jgi:hypothetical protein
MILSPKKNFRTHRGRDQESGKAKQRKDRNRVQSPDMGLGTSDKRCKECSNIRGKKVGWGLA